MTYTRQVRGLLCRRGDTAVVIVAWVLAYFVTGAFERVGQYDAVTSHSI